MKKIEMMIECPSCSGTGLYSGMGESDNVAIICPACKGSGQFHYMYEYNEFEGRKEKEGIDRVYLKGYGYKIRTGVINFSGIGEIDMDKEGVSYQEFLEGKQPKHIKTLACPMLADQSACHKIKDFTNKCDELNGGWLSGIKKCDYRDNKAKCWERFEN